MVNEWNRRDVIAHLQGKVPPFYLVAIDGRSGSGKSTFAEEIADQVKHTQIVHGDDFYRVMDEAERLKLDAAGGYQLYIDWQRLKRDVLDRFRRGEVARYRQYDWGANVLAGWKDVHPQGLVLVEGVYSTRPELRHFFDLTIYVEVAEEVRIQRQIERDQNSLDWIKRWAAAEEYFEANFSPAKKADMIVSGGS